MKKRWIVTIASVICSCYCIAQNKIIYNVLVDKQADNYDVFIMNMDGSSKRNITNHKDVAWTYLGGTNKVYFISDRDTCRRCYFLYEMDSDGNNIRKLTDLQLEDSWLSSRNNGKELVVAGRIGKQIRYQLFIVNTDNGGHRQLTNDTVARYSDPVFSPDGKQIAFVYKKNKRARETPEEIYVMNEDGSGLKQLTHYPENDTLIRENGYKAGPPRWNIAEKLYYLPIFTSWENYSLYAVTPDGTRQWKLTDLKMDEGWHDWSKDGNWLAIELFDDAQSQFPYRIDELENERIENSYR